MTDTDNFQIGYTNTAHKRIIFETQVRERERYGFFQKVRYGYGKQDVNSTDVSNLAKLKHFRMTKFRQKSEHCVWLNGEMVKMDFIGMVVEI